MRVDVADGVALHAEVLGDGPTMLVLHGGLGMDHTYFRPDFDRLASAGTVVYLDHRGNGRSERTLEPLTVTQLAADAAAAIEAIGKPATVIGHSFGGFIAQELAVTRPELVDRLVLLCTTPGQLGEKDDLSADQGPPPPEELMALWSLQPDTDAAYRDQVDAMVPFYVTRAVDELRDRLTAVQVDIRACQEGFATLATWSSVDRLDGLRMPVLIVAGGTDHFTSAQQSERIARQIRHGDLRVIAGCGHFPWLDDPEAFWPDLDAWLAG